MSVEPEPGRARASSLAGAFPTALEADVLEVLEWMPSARFEPVHRFSAVVDGESVLIPERLHHPEPHPSVAAAFSARQSAILGCLYSRHHDGYIRQRWIEQVMDVDEPWVAPFVVKLVEEYVLEIVEAIRRGLPDLVVVGSAQQRRYGRFLAANPELFARTERRVVSHWSCYRRSLYPEFRTYPGSDLLVMLRTAAELETGRSWPRHTLRGRARTPRSR